MPDEDRTPRAHSDPWAGLVDETTRNTIREELNELSEKEGEGGVIQKHRFPPPVEDWLKCVDQTSWNNREWGVGLWHVLAGLMLRGLRIPAGGDHLDSRVHVLILGPSRSGKTRAVNMAQRALERMVDGPDNIYSLTEATTAGLIGTSMPGISSTGKTVMSVKRFVPGLLGKADLIRWDEAETMFHETPYNVNMLRALNQAMNPIGSPGNRVNKALAGLEEPGGVSPACALTTTAVDFLNVPEGVLRSGFLQRNLVFWKDLTIEDRKVNSDARRKLAVKESASPAQADMDKDLGASARILERLMRLSPEMFRTDDGVPRFEHRVDGVQSVEFEPRVDAGVEVYYQRWLNYTSLMDPVMRVVFTDFVEGAVDKLRVLAVHYAAIRALDGLKGGRLIVNRDDLEHSKPVVTTSLLQLSGYLKTVSYAWRELRARQAAHDRGKG